MVLIFPIKTLKDGQLRIMLLFMDILGKLLTLLLELLSCQLSMLALDFSASSTKV